MIGGGHRDPAGSIRVSDVADIGRAALQPGTRRTVSGDTGSGGERVAVKCSVLGGCAYLIRLGAASAMLARSEHIDMPIDQTLDRYWENGIIPYVLRPTPVWHEDLFESEIGERGRALQNQPARKVVAQRRVQRLVDSLNKRLFWLAFRVPSLGAVMSRMGVTSARMAMIALWGGQVIQRI